MPTKTDTATTASYIYNVDGIRTSKTVNGVTTTYRIVDGTMHSLTDGTKYVGVYFRKNEFN